jgi:hypothetical protein
MMRSLNFVVLVLLVMSPVSAWSADLPDLELIDLSRLLPAGSDWLLEVATGINNSGAIVGYGRRAGLPGQRAFLLRPTAFFRSGFEQGTADEW